MERRTWRRNCERSGALLLCPEYSCFRTYHPCQRPDAASPPAVTQKIAGMDAACRVAGGRPGGGAYIFVQDFSGDGVNDFLISEGNYNCIGKSDAFRAAGKAAVEIYVTRGSDAFRGFYEVVRGYRILDTRPRTVQIVRDGAACGRAPSATCTVSLRWDSLSGNFTAHLRRAHPSHRQPSQSPRLVLPSPPPWAF